MSGCCGPSLCRASDGRRIFLRELMLAANGITFSTESNTGKAAPMGHTLTSKGQVTIPKAIRDHLGLKPGSKVEFEIDGVGAVQVRGESKKRKRKIDWDKIRGTANTGLSTSDIMWMTRGRRI
jgi:AbrB family looped-hinge helix DNA binding protein